MKLPELIAICLAFALLFSWLTILETIKAARGQNCNLFPGLLAAIAWAWVYLFTNYQAGSP